MTAKVERLVNLTVALLHARRPLTLATIRRRVAGYGHDSDESARRMFERDKDELRRLGVPIETVPLDPFHTEWGYIIERDKYALPPVDLTAEEVGALAVAVQLTGEQEARLAFAKLAARAPDPHETEAPPARIDVGGGAIDPIAAAVVERRALVFGYRSADGSEAQRTVDPYGLVQRRGAWYLVGHDHDRDAVRSFKVERMTSAPRPGGEPGAYEVPAGVDAARFVAGPEVAGRDVVAAFAPEVAWEAARRDGRMSGERDDGWTLVTFPAADPDRLLPWVLGFGAAAEVVAPPDVRDEARRRLEAIAAPGRGRTAAAR